MVCQGEALDTPVDAAVVVLVDEAKDGRLSICAGAGLSMSAGLPSGARLARELDARFQRVAGYECASPSDLLAVADAAARLPEGLQAVQRAALDLFPFDSARPQLEHRLLSLLVAEGALTLLLTNWDNCVERSRQGTEPIPAARNDREAEELRGAFILKIHGCCTQSGTLLITSDQLREPDGIWTKAFFQAQLAQSTMVFVGIGDVADYAKQRITELATWVDSARVRVVSPDVDRGWEESAWREILPVLPEARRIGTSAATFVDQVAREWVMQLVESLRRSDEDGRAELVASAFVLFTAVQALEWLRRAMAVPLLGDSVVRDPGAESLLEAIGLMAHAGNPEAPAVRFLRGPAVLVNGTRVEALMCRSRQTPADIEMAATDRVRDFIRRRGPADQVDVLVAASSIRGPKPRVLPAVSIFDPDAPVDDLVGGPESVRVTFTYADELLEAA